MLDAFFMPAKGRHSLNGNSVKGWLLIFLWMVLPPPSLLLAQSSPPPLSPGEQTMELGFALEKEGKFPAAMKELLKAETMLLEEKKYEKYISVLILLDWVHDVSRDVDGRWSYIQKAVTAAEQYLPVSAPLRGTAYLNKSMFVGRYFQDYEQEEELVKKAFKALRHSDLHDDLFYCYRSKIFILSRKGDLKGAENLIDSLTTIIATEFPPGKDYFHPLSDIYISIYYEHGAYDRILEISKKVISHVQNTPIEQFSDTLYVVKAYGRMTQIFFEKRDYKHSLAVSQVTSSLMEASNKFPRCRVADNQYMVGLSYRFLGEKEKALHWMLKSYRLQTLPNSPCPDKEMVSRMIAIYSLARRLGDLELAAEFRELIVTSDQSDVTSYYEFYSEDGLFEISESHLTKGLTLFKKASQHLLPNASPPSPSLAEIYLYIGETFFALEQQDSALFYMQKALHWFFEGFTEKDVSQNPDITSKASHWFAFKVFAGKGKCFQKMETPGGTSFLQKAYSNFALALNFAGQFRQQSGNAESRIEFSSEVFSIFEKAIETCFDLYERTGADSFALKAFTYAQQSQSLALLEQEMEQQKMGVGSLPSELRGEKLQLKRNLIFYREKILQEKDKGAEADTLKLRTWQSQELGIQIALDDWENKVSELFPEFQRFQQLQADAPLTSIQSQILLPNEALIQFFTGKESMFTFLVDKSGLKTFRQTLPGSFEHWIQSYHRSLSDYAYVHDSVAVSYRAFCEASQHLYRFLLEAPLKNLPEISRLLIITGGSLQKIPFETLVTSPPSSDRLDFGGLAYLLRRYTLRYGYSASILTEAHKRSPGVNNSKLLAFAPDYGSSNPSYSQRGSLKVLRSSDFTLSGALKEVEQLSRLDLDGDYFFGADATEAHFKIMAPEYNLLHLAMHGKSDSQNPLNSGLLFSSENQDSCEDNVLHGFELLAVPLKAKLAVLSACETGTGRFAAGEGIMSLGRDFLAAGAKSVVMTLWQVEDQASTRLIELFYKGLQTGLSVADALHEAKSLFLKEADSRLAHPFYWAGYVANGDSGLVLSQKKKSDLDLATDRVCLAHFWSPVVA